MDSQDGNIDGIEDLDVEEVADAEHPYTRVTAEDLSTDELVYDGADAADLIPGDTEQPIDEAMHEDDTFTEETLDERIRQEEPDPASDVAYGEPLGTDEGDFDQ